MPLNYHGNAGINQRLTERFGTSDLAKALGVDFRGVGPRYIGPKLHEDKGDVRVNDWGIHMRWVEHSAGGYWDYCDWPLTEATLAELAAATGRK